MSNTVFVMSSITFEYDDERFYETDSRAVNAVYAKKEDAEEAVRKAIIRDLQTDGLEIALSASTADGISREKFDQIVALVGEDRIEFHESDNEFFIYSVYVGVNLTEEKVEELAKLIEYCPYVINEMEVK